MGDGESTAIIGGKHRVRRVIGSGGMGIRVRSGAHHPPIVSPLGGASASPPPRAHEPLVPRPPATPPEPPVFTHRSPILTDSPTALDIEDSAAEARRPRRLRREYAAWIAAIAAVGAASFFVGRASVGPERVVVLHANARAPEEETKLIPQAAATATAAASTTATATATTAATAAPKASDQVDE
jgi:hypothetical protein